MAVKIRLSRHGKKNYAFFHIVVADTRAPRDGRYIEQIGTYDPNPDPAVIILDTDKAYEWLCKGAQPSPTCRRILSYKGVLLKKHLLEGVRKGALTEEAAKEKLEAWMQDKEAKISDKKSRLAQDNRNAHKVKLEAEAKVNAVRAAALAEKRREAAAKLAAAAEAAAQAAAEAIAEVEGSAAEPAPESLPKD